ncbi:MAG: glycosyltransferase family 39 protein [Betaproteobacteria bacterium]|nr:glycosyltransferase family 39 protein [Betaproteobacteria bacterium]
MLTYSRTEVARASPISLSTAALIVLICAAWILPGLIGHDPWKPDEAYTFGVVNEILKGGSWIVPGLAGEPFLVDPPLFYLTAAASAVLFSPPLPLHDAARLVTGFYMALTFVFCALSGRELSGERRGMIAMLLLLGCFGLVIRSHQLIADAASLAGFAIAYYGLALALRRPLAGGFWIGTGAGLVFMTQGLLETAIIALTAAVLPLFSPWRNRTYGSAIAMALIAAAPWLAIWPSLLYAQSPALFDQWLWKENVTRLLAGGSAAGLMYYLRILPWYAWPVWPIALWALWRAHETGFDRPAVLLPLCGFLVTLTLLSLAPDARELYALPLLIPLTLLANSGVGSLRRGAANAWYWFSVMAFTFFVIVAWFYWTGLELGMPARLHGHLHRIQPGYDPGFKLLPFVLGAVYSLAWFGVLVGLRRSPDRPVFAWATGITTIWGLLAILFIGWIDTGKSYRSMVVSLQQALPKKYDCLSSRNLGEAQRAMLHYFGEIITQREEVAERRRNCEFLLVQGSPRYEVPPRGAWRKIWEGGRPGDKDERYRLYQRARAP